MGWPESLCKEQSQITLFQLTINSLPDPGEMYQGLQVELWLHQELFNVSVTALGD